MCAKNKVTSHQIQRGSPGVDHAGDRDHRGGKEQEVLDENSANHYPKHREKWRYLPRRQLHAARWEGRLIVVVVVDDGGLYLGGKKLCTCPNICTLSWVHVVCLKTILTPVVPPLVKLEIQCIY